MSSLERSRHTRSHSLKPLSQPSLLTQRSKRTLSLPSKPIIPPLIHIQRYYEKEENFSDDEKANCTLIQYEQTSMEVSKKYPTIAWYTPVVGLSCSLVIYFWSCALAYYSTS